MQGLIIDYFAGGGGASLAIEDVLGRVDYAVNHDVKAIAMHKANHPNTIHLCENVFRVDIEKLVAGRKVGLMHFSPDCTHHSRAKGGKPVKKQIRGLAWIVVRCARLVRPDVITLENVGEFRDWGPLTRCGRPNKDRKGQTFNFWVEKLKRYGYKVEWKKLKACDYGDPTIRERLFLIARCDGLPIVWPEPTHGPGLEPFHTAAECIDWSIPCPSIFERKKPLAENTMKRIARGLKKFVIDAEEPFIVGVGGRAGQSPERSVEEPLGTVTAKGDRALVTPFLTKYHGFKSDSDARGFKPDEPFKTLDTQNRFSLIMPYVARIGQTGGGDNYSYDVEKPLTTVTSKAEHLLIAPHLSRQFGQGTGRRVDGPAPTITADGQGKTALVSAFIAKHFGGVTGVRVDTPWPTTTQRGTQNQIVTSHMLKLRGTCRHGQPVTDPMATITGGGMHLGEVRAFLMKYYGKDGSGMGIKDPIHTISSKERFGLVTVAGEEYQIIDIGMRMLTPRELFRAHSFPEDYIIDPLHEGKRLTKTDQVAKVGNSVARRVYAAVLQANVGEALQEATA